MATIRRPGAASFTVLIGLSVSMVAAHLIAPEWSRRVGLDVWNLAAAEEDQRLVIEERNDVDAKAEQCVRRRAVADQLATRLITREADLGTVAVELLDLFGDDSTLCTIEACNPGIRDPRLLYARHALVRVGRLLGNDPARREAVLARLESEYRELVPRWSSAP